MIPRFLNLQGMIGIAAALLLLSLCLVKAGEARHWRKQSGRYEQLYLAEQGARAQTIANYRAAAETARKEDLANASRVAAEQRTISERISHDLEARLADARARAQRLQLGQGSPPATNGSGRAAAVPAAGAAPRAAGRAPQEDGLSLDAKSLSVEERLLATEQAIQLDELIKWVTGQAAVDPKSGFSPSPSARGPDER
jgi:signal transduction histidine kinase